MEQHKFYQPDILSCLTEIVQKNTRAYTTDFDFDAKRLWDSAQESDMERRSFLWMCRPLGTWCVLEREVFLDDTNANCIWTHYADCPEGILAYRNAFKDYFEDIRGISNEVSRKYGFSVIQPEGSGQHYAEWNAERSGKTTIRDLVRQDLDAAIAASFTFASLLDILRKRGYTVKYGSNVKHTAVKPPGGARFLRLDKTIHRHRPEITLPVVLPLRGTYSAGCPQSRPVDADASAAEPASVRTGWALTATTQRKCGSQGEQTREAR